jgi:hypothetical protein
MLGITAWWVVAGVADQKAIRNNAVHARKHDSMCLSVSSLDPHFAIAAPKSSSHPRPTSIRATGFIDRLLERTKCFVAQDELEIIFKGAHLG